MAECKQAMISARRQDSVRNGLLALGPCAWVAVHDAARPFATAELLRRTWAAAERTGAAAAAVPVVDTIKRWLGNERRAGPGTHTARPLHQECLKQTPFCALTEVRFVQPHVWTYDGIIGYLHSTSFASRAVVGDNSANFEKDLRERLSGLSPDGRFADEIEYSVISARRE